MNSAFEKQTFKRVLIISYNALSSEGSNGRTIKNLFCEWPADNLAQFYMANELPDNSCCNHYYRVTDEMVLKAALFRHNVKNGVIENKKNENINASLKKPSSRFNGILHGVGKRYKKLSISKIIRNRIWKSERWRSEAFDQWLNEFNPEVVFTISGKLPQLHYIAERISAQRNIPLVSFHCEDYCFKNKYPHSLLYKKYIKDLKKSIDALFNQTAHAIYLNPAVKALYERYYKVPGTVIYTSTDVVRTFKKESKNRIPVISYMGNTTNGRLNSLLEFSKSVETVGATLNIYCHPLKRKEILPFCKYTNTHFCGFIPYEKCLNVLRESDFILHTESFMNADIKDVSIAFSTKIADSLASGTCLITYAPKNIASTDYLLKTGASFVISDRDTLNQQLSLILKNTALQNEIIEKANETVEANHRSKVNGQKIYHIIENVCDKDRIKVSYLTSYIKSECCGCRACVEICPQKCITMVKDRESFYYPQIDPTQCIQCDKCRKVCPIENQPTLNKAVSAYVGISNSPKTVYASSSGGGFTEIYNYAVNNRYTVFGVKYTDKLRVVTDFAETIEGCEAFRKSKYVISDTSGCFSKVRDFLEEGRGVLFSGTPCQNAALRNYLKKDYDRLICVDIVCHGVASQDLFDKHIKELNDKYKDRVISYQFKNKEPYRGKINSRTAKIVFASGKTKVVSVKNDAYLKAYYSRLCYRPSCSCCPYAQIDRCSDITLGDAWHIEELYPEFKSLHGVSLILLNTKKGAALFDNIKGNMTTIEIPISFAFEKNQQLRIPTEFHKDRNNFFTTNLTYSLEKSAGKYVSYTIFSRIINKLKTKIKR